MKGVVPLIATLLLCLAGCSGHGGLEGQWTGDLHIQASPGENQDVAHTLSKVELKSTPIGFELLWQGINYRGMVYGNQLQAETALNQPLQKPLTFRLAHDNTHMILTSPDGVTVRLLPRTPR